MKKIKKEEKASFIVYRYAHIWRHNEYPLFFYTLPMIHIGEQTFYQEINSIIEGFNQILVEGTNIKIASKDFGKYSIIAKELNLSTQSESIRIPNDVKKINIDIGVQVMNQKIKKVSFREKMFLKSYNRKFKRIQKLENPVALLKQVIGYPHGSEHKLINPKNHYHFTHRIKNSLELVLQNDRDDVFQKKLSDYIEANKNRKYRFDVGIMVGSEHMPAIYRELEKNGFKWELLKKITVIN